ncbi:MAG: hypothetical protein EPN58_11485 [Rhodanobacter sp.]|nr:MAG: hypothetical protein EPN58_11485 [Rhodanobacter sp.]
MNRDKPRSTNNTGVSSAGESQGQNLRRDPKVAARNQRIVARYQDGTPIKDLATEFGVSISLVTIVIRAAGLTKTRGKPRDPKVAERNKRIVARYQEGVPVKELATEFGISRSLVTTVNSAAGVTKTRRRQADLEVAARNQRIVARYQDGTRIKELATEFGVSIGLVTTVIRAAGLTKTRGKPRDPEVAARNQRIVTRYQKGVPLKDLATEFGITLSLVCSVTSRAGVSNRQSVSNKGVTP